MAQSLNGHDLWKKIAYDRNNRIQSSELPALKEVFDAHFDEWKPVEEYQIKNFINGLYSLSGWSNSRISQLKSAISKYLS